MLVLKYDVKCGFANVYVVERNIVFPLGDLLDQVRQKDGKADEQIILEQYKACPEQLFDDYGLAEIIYTGTKLDFAKLYFKHLCIDGATSPVLPEICEIYNIRLEEEDDETNDQASENSESTEEEKDFLKRYYS